MIYEWHFKKFLEVYARKEILFVCKAITADGILRVLLFASAPFGFLVSALSQEQKKAVILMCEMKTQSRIRVNKKHFFVRKDH